MNEPIATLPPEADLPTSTSRVTAEQLAAAARSREYWATRHLMPSPPDATEHGHDDTPDARPN